MHVFCKKKKKTVHTRGNMSAQGEHVRAETAVSGCKSTRYKGLSRVLILEAKQQQNSHSKKTPTDFQQLNYLFPHSFTFHTKL